MQIRDVIWKEKFADKIADKHEVGTYEGRYLIVFFIHKHGNAALPISARDMTTSERRYYERQK